MRLIEVILSVISLIIVSLIALKSFRQMGKFEGLIPDFDSLFQIKKENGQDVVYIDPRLDALVNAFGSRISQSIKMSFLQGLGADAKLQKGLEGAMAQDIIDEKMPLLNLAGEFLGFNTKQYIAKNPRAIGQLAQLAAPFLGQMMNQRGNSNPSNSSYRSKY